MPTRQQAEQFETEGYFVADDAVEPGMFDELASAARRVKHKADQDRSTFSRTGPPTRTPNLGRSAACSPRSSPVFAEYLTSKPVMDYVHAFIGDDLTMGSILIFTNPHHADYSIGWHRD